MSIYSISLVGSRRVAVCHHDTDRATLEATAQDKGVSRFNGQLGDTPVEVVAFYWVSDVA